MTAWTREHDATLARECEGIEVCHGIPSFQEVVGGFLVIPVKELGEADYIDRRMVGIPRYSTDITACLRAAEAWKDVDKNNRGYEIRSMGSENVRAQCWENVHGDSVRIGIGDTPAQALAWALYWTVKGTKCNNSK